MMEGERLRSSATPEEGERPRSSATPQAAREGAASPTRDTAAREGAASPTRNSAVAAVALSKSYAHVHALDRLHLEIPRGAAFGLIGPNGAGKTTFIKLLLGIARPSSGDVRVLGRPPEDVSAREKVGYLPERLHLPGAWKPPAYLRSIATLKGLREAPIEALLTRVGLREASSRRIGGFSKGMRQRLGLAAALLGSPQLLVLDEPTDGIDPLGRVEMRDLLLEEKKRGATLLLNSHLLAETERVCDRIGILHQGRLVTSGTIESLKSVARGYELHFAEGCDVEKLKALGLEPVAGHFRTSVEDAGELNALIDRARATGALLVRLEHAAKDLEQLLKDATG